MAANPSDRHRHRYLRTSRGYRGPDGRAIPPPTPIEIIRRITRRNALDPRLEPTDRHMQRWGASQGSGLPVDPDTADALPRLKLAPLPDDQAIITDLVVLRSPTHWRRFVHSWYRSPKPPEVIAAELGLSRSGVYDERRLVLAYLFGCLTAVGVPIPAYTLR